MTTQETYLTAFTESVSAIAERFIQVSQFDKTIEATIVEKNTDINIYYVLSQGGARFSVPTLRTDTTIYSIGDQVYISLPNGDYNSNNKYIIGKVNKILPKILVMNRDNYLIEDYHITTTSHSNKKCYQMMIIEFDACINSNISEAKMVEEMLIAFDIFGASKEDSNKYIHNMNYWSTKNLYGNIFDKEIINKQKIIIRDLENLNTFGIKWNGEGSVKNLSLPIKVLDIYGNNLESKSSLEINNIIYYIGYDIEKISQNQIQNTSILLTYEGYKLFHFKDDKWTKIDFEDLEELEPEYNWSISWYNWNPMQENYTSIDNPVPQYWDSLNKEPSDYKNKLVLLQCDKGSNITTKTIYSILR